jgi:hypothetical protein
MAPPSRKRARGNGSGGGGGGASDRHLPWLNVRNQDVLSTDYVEIDPINKADLDGEKAPSQVDFEYSATKPVLFGPMTKFAVKGCFYVKKDAASDWKEAEAADIADVVLQYNWFEMLIKSVDVFHNNQRITSSNEQRFISAYLNTMLYAYMDPDTKKFLCPQAAHPANCLPKEKNKWSTASQSWKDYAAHVFKGASFYFDFFPMFQFPFYLGSNFVNDPNVPRLLPLDRLGKMHVRFTFFDKQDHIFRKPGAGVAAANKMYRFAFEEFKMCLEEVRLSPALERQLATKSRMEFPGVTRLQLVDTVPDASPTHKIVFQDIYLPEAILIFCLDKQVSSGTFNFGTATDQNVFKDHRIRYLDFSFDNKKFCLKEPNFGKFREDRLVLKQLADYLMFPMFGIYPDPAKLNLSAIQDGGAQSPFPHVYVPLCGNFAKKERLVPATDDGSCISRKSDLEIAIQFELANSQPSAVYVCYAIYTDVGNILDVKSQYFSSPYLRYM